MCGSAVERANQPASCDKRVASFEMHLTRCSWQHFHLDLWRFIEELVSYTKHRGSVGSRSTSLGRRAEINIDHWKEYKRARKGQDTRWMETNSYLYEACRVVPAGERDAQWRLTTAILRKCRIKGALNSGSQPWLGGRCGASDHRIEQHEGRSGSDWLVLRQSVALTPRCSRLASPPPHNCGSPAETPPSTTSGDMPRITDVPSSVNEPDEGVSAGSSREAIFERKPAECLVCRLPSLKTLDGRTHWTSTRASFSPVSPPFPQNCRRSSFHFASRHGGCLEISFYWEGRQAGQVRAR